MAEANLDIQVSDSELTQLIATMKALTEAMSDNKTETEELGKASEETSEKGSRLSTAMRGAGVGIAAAGAAALAAAGAIVALGSAVFNTTREVAGIADEAGKAAQGLGITAEAYQSLAVAANFSGTSIETVSMALGKLVQTASLAEQGGQGQIGLLARLGVEATNAAGNLNTADDMLGQVADTIQALGPGAEATALAIAAFGEQGGKLIPLLLAGSEGIQAMTDEAQRFGAVVSNEGADAAAAFNDELYRLELATTGLKNTLAESLMPAFVEVLGVVGGQNGLVNSLAALKRVLDDNKAGIRELIFNAVILANDTLGVLIEIIASSYSAFVELEAIVKSTTATLELFSDVIVDNLLGPFDDLYRLVQNIPGPFEEWSESMLNISRDLEEGRGRADDLSDSAGTLSRVVADLSAELRYQRDDIDDVNAASEDLAAQGLDALINRYSFLKQGVGSVNELLQRQFPILRTLMGLQSEAAETPTPRGSGGGRDEDLFEPPKVSPEDLAEGMMGKAELQQLRDEFWDRLGKAIISPERKEDLVRLMTTEVSSLNEELIAEISHGQGELMDATGISIHEISESANSGIVEQAYATLSGGYSDLIDRVLEDVSESSDKIDSGASVVFPKISKALQESITEVEAYFDIARDSAEFLGASEEYLLDIERQRNEVLAETSSRYAKLQANAVAATAAMADSLKKKEEPTPDLSGFNNQVLDRLPGMDLDGQRDEIKTVEEAWNSLTRAQQAYAKNAGMSISDVNTALIEQREAVREAFKTEAVDAMRDSLGDFASYAGQALAGVVDSQLSAGEKAKKLLGSFFGDFLQTIGRTAIAQGIIVSLGDPAAGGLPNPGRGAALIGAGIAATVAGAAISGKAGAIGGTQKKDNSTAGGGATPSSASSSGPSTTNVFIENRFGNRFDARELDRSAAETFAAAAANGQI